MSEVTIPVTELIKLCQHAVGGSYFFNLPRKGDMYHRCVRVSDTYPNPTGEPSFTFEYQENGNRIATISHSLRDLFETLPLMRAFLAEQRGDAKSIPNELLQAVIKQLQQHDSSANYTTPPEMYRALGSL